MQVNDCRCRTASSSRLRADAIKVISLKVRRHGAASTVLRVMPRRLWRHQAIHPKEERTMTTIRTAVLATTLALGLAAASAVRAEADVKEIPLKDGTTLLIYKDGKMSHRDDKGRVVQMKNGSRMVTKDGTVLMMVGNEIWRKTDREQLNEQMYRGR
jgi:Copper resistance protein K